MDETGLPVQRRSVLVGLAAGTALATVLDAVPTIAAAAGQRKRYAFVGVGSRNRMYQRAI